MLLVRSDILAANSRNLVQSGIIKMTFSTLGHQLFERVSLAGDHFLQFQDEASVKLLPQLILATNSAQLNSPFFLMSGERKERTEIDLTKFDIKSPDGNPNNNIKEMLFQVSVAAGFFYVFYEFVRPFG